MKVRIPIGGLALALSSIALALPAAALATTSGSPSGNGGTSVPTPAADGPVDPAFAISARPAAHADAARCGQPAPAVRHPGPGDLPWPHPGGPGGRSRSLRAPRPVGPHRGGREAARNDRDEPHRRRSPRSLPATPSSLST